MPRSLRQWAKFGRAANIFAVLLFVFVILFSIFSCQDVYIGKTRHELSQEMFEVDSLIKLIQFQVDSLNAEIDGTLVKKYE